MTKSTHTPSNTPIEAARRVLRQTATAALGTLDANSAPFVSLVATATAPDGEPILLLSRLAAHTRNLARDTRGSLLLAGTGPEAGEPLAGTRLTLAGAIAGPQSDPMLRRRFLASNPEAEQYADFADFGFYRFRIERGHLVAGFGRIVGLSREELLTDCSGADDLLAAEESAIAHMNADHRDALVLYATRLLGQPDGNWRTTGVDPDGIDLRTGTMRARLSFDAPVMTGGALREVLARLAKDARERA